MTTEDSHPAGVRGAIDLSAGGAGSPGATGPAHPASGGRAVPGGLVVEVTEANVQEVLSRTLQVPALLVLWSSQHPATAEAVDLAVEVALPQNGRLQVLSADLAVSQGLTRIFQPLIMQAFGGPAIPATFGVIQGQPVPLYPALVPPAEALAVVQELLQMAVQNGITGRVELTPVEGAEEAPLPPLHQKAFDAIEAGDLDAAEAAYREALAENPKDHDADLGLAQVNLLRRTQGADLAAVRAAAAADPADVDAALAVADLDVLGGHVEDAFARLLDLVRGTAGEDRDRVRQRLIELFSVVGNDDERVRRGRTALMSALF